MIEFSIAVKGEDSTLSKKYLEYDTELTLSHEDPFLARIVQEQVKEYNQPVESIIIKAKMIW